MPSCPIAIEQVTVTVVNSHGVPPASFSATFTDCAGRFSVTLQEAASFQQVATPIQGCWISSFVRPMA